MTDVYFVIDIIRVTYPLILSRRALTSSATGHCGTCHPDFQQYFSAHFGAITVYNGQLYLVPYFVLLRKCVELATTGILSRLESTEIVWILAGPPPTLTPSRPGRRYPSPFFTQSTHSLGGQFVPPSRQIFFTVHGLTRCLCENLTVRY